MTLDPCTEARLMITAARVAVCAEILNEISTGSPDVPDALGDRPASRIDTIRRMLEDACVDLGRTAADIDELDRHPATDPHSISKTVSMA